MDVILLDGQTRLARGDLGECPRCREGGTAGRLKLIERVKSGLPGIFGIAGCRGSTVSSACGYTALVRKRGRPKPGRCPECGKPMRQVRRRDGGHALVCVNDGWFLADARWQVVRSPICPRCRKPMVHRERSAEKGRFFWACFEDRTFVDSDVFGAMTRTNGRPGRSPRE